MRYFSFVFTALVIILLSSCAPSGPRTGYRVVNETNHHYNRRHHHGYGSRNTSRKQRYWGRHRYGNKIKRTRDSITY